MGAIARRITRVITAVVCVAVSVGVSVATLHVPTREGGGERFNPARYRSDVIVTMFQANWKSVARECGEVLGPEGVGYVQGKMGVNIINILLVINIETNEAARDNVPANIPICKATTKIYAIKCPFPHRNYFCMDFSFSRPVLSL